MYELIYQSLTPAPITSKRLRTFPKQSRATDPINKTRVQTGQTLREIIHYIFGVGMAAVSRG